VEGSLHLCTKSYHPKKGFLFLLYCCTCANYLLYILEICSSATKIFLRSRLNMNYVNELQNMHLFLGVLARLQTVNKLYIV
jgi:hypothetical protein